MTVWETVRRQVAITGQISETYTGAAVSGALVQLQEAPPGFPARAHSAADGRFYFLDLPDGVYVLEASLPDPGSRFGMGNAEVTVARNDAGDILLATADIAIPSTTVRGTVRDQSGEGIHMARVRMVGSGEETFSDKDGNYLLSGLESAEESEAPRTVAAAARGYFPTTSMVLINQAGGLYDNIDFTLKEAP